MLVLQETGTRRCLRFNNLAHGGLLLTEGEKKTRGGGKGKIGLIEVGKGKKRGR